MELNLKINQPLPSFDEFPGEDDVDAEQRQGPLQEHDDGHGDVENEDEGRRAENTARGCLQAWKKLVEETIDVAVKNITFVETIEGRNSHHVLPAVARIYSRLRQLGLPVARLHTDRAREFVAAPLRKWAQHRDIVLTKTAGDDYKANGRVEAELGVTKRAIRTVLSAGGYNIEWWPLIAKHVGERRLRAQLRVCGYPVGDLLRFGTRVFALRKWWQHRYEQWRDIREPVLVLGPDACSTLTSTNYFVQAIDSGRYFFTADIITVDFAAADGAVLNQEDPQPGVDPAAPRPIAAADEIYLPERDEQSQPAGLDLQPARRLRSKTSPAMLHRLAQASIEGKDVAHGEVHGEVHGGAPQIPRWEMEPDIFERLGRVDTPSWDRQSDEESWSLETRSSRPSSPGSLVESGGGDEEGAPNNRDGGSCPTASNNKKSFLRRMQHNLHQLVMEEMSMIDATTEDQVWCMPILKEMLVKKAAVEEELNVINKEKKEVETQAAANEFLVTKTVANKEVWDNIQDWEPSVRAEFEQLVNQKASCATDFKIPASTNSSGKTAAH